LTKVCYTKDGGRGAFLKKCPFLPGKVGTVLFLGQKHTKKFPQKSFKKGVDIWRRMWYYILVGGKQGRREKPKPTGGG
jgi:hypothetical protein